MKTNNRFEKDGLSLEHIVHGLKKTEPEINISLDCSGLYDRLQQKIFYNPAHIQNTFERNITIIHELMHYYNFDSFMDHDYFDVYATDLLIYSPHITDYLHDYFLEENEDD